MGSWVGGKFNEKLIYKVKALVIILSAEGQ